MLQLENGTGFPATLFVSPDADGIESVYTVLKATFEIGSGLTPAGQQVPIRPADEHHDDNPVASSIAAPGDLSLEKPCTDVLLVGTAHAPGGRPSRAMDVSLAVGPIRKTVRVFGDRVWEDTGLGPAISDPKPFQKMPLVWERAYGGTVESDEGPVAEHRNPVGRGFHGENGAGASGRSLPNLEDPQDPITSPRQAPQPACFAPVAPHWEPRRSHAGSYDERWQKDRAPYLPGDFDSRFFQLAPPGQVANGYLSGGEPVEIRGATPAGVLRFRLPTLRPSVTYVMDHANVQGTFNLDTVLIEPDADRCILVWRVAQPCKKGALTVREVRVELIQPTG